MVYTIFMKNKVHDMHKKDSVTRPHLYQSLSGIPFPATRKDIIEYARNKGASGGIIYVLEKLPDRHFKSEADVLDSLNGEL